MRVLAVVIVLGCGAKGDPKLGEKPGSAVPIADPDPCSAETLSLGKATELPAWTPPAGCTAKSMSGRAISTTDVELGSQLECTASVRPGVDLTKHAVLSITESMSPATVGWFAYDDGTAITLVTKFRSPCPNDPRPMPMSTTRWYLMPAGAKRSFAQSTCTIRPKCEPT